MEMIQCFAPTNDSDDQDKEEFCSRLLTMRDLQIGLRVRDRVRVRFSNFKPVTRPEPLFFMLVLGRKNSSWDEMGLCCDNVQPEN